MNAPPAAPVRLQGPPRWHLLLASGVLLLFGVGMGFFLNWVGKTSRPARTTPNEEAHGSAPKPSPRDDADKLDVAALDFGEVAPLPAFSALEMPALPAQTKPAEKPKPPAPKPEEKPTPLPKPEKKPPPQKIDNAPVQTEKPVITWKLKAGDTFLHELIVSQSPVFRTQGLTFQSQLKYSVVSRFTVEQAGPGGAVVNQRVEGARLIQADATTQGLVMPALAKLPGTAFKIQLGPEMEVKRFTGAQPQLLAGGGGFAGGFGLQTASLLDLDGWCEIAQATFFQPARGAAPRSQWVRPMNHNWGALGAWTGQTLFVYSGRQGPLHQFTFGHRMAHVPARGGAMGPLQVAGAAFQARVADGAVVFDAERGRVVSGQERFAVTGRIHIAILGQQASVDIEEEQTFQFRLIEPPQR
jgi:hypothetical protein